MCDTSAPCLDFAGNYVALPKGFDKNNSANGELIVWTVAAHPVAPDQDWQH